MTIELTDMLRSPPFRPSTHDVDATPGAAAGLTVNWTAISQPLMTRPSTATMSNTAKRPPLLQRTWTEVSVTTNSATITGLEYSTIYEVQVRSKNVEGVSGWSPTGEGEIPSLLDVTLSPATRTVNEGSSASIHRYRLARSGPRACPFPFQWHVVLLKQTITAFLD